MSRGLEHLSYKAEKVEFIQPGEEKVAGETLYQPYST